MRGVKVFFSVVVIIAALALLIYPALVLATLCFDSTLQHKGQSRLVPGWFMAASGRFVAWADEYANSQFAVTVYHNDVAATEWPMFGAVLFLVTAHDLHQQGLINGQAGVVRKAVEKAASIVASPTTATWVKTKWGDHYLEQENVFYRMLLILGLSAFEELTGDQQYRSVMSEQRKTLAAELSVARLHLKDDYPGECYPNDVLWAVAAIQRAARLEDTNHHELVMSLMTVFDGPVKAKEGLPAFQVDATSGQILQHARGCGNSGILLFASELDAEIARRWYDAYEQHFWTNNLWYSGFREFPHGASDAFDDVDSGPVVWGVGSVASAFGIGAAKTVGRLDHSVPLTLEAVAASWPTPFGFLVPGIMGKLAAQSWCLGEVALLFSMTRPLPSTELTPATGQMPGMVWIYLSLYTGSGLLVIVREFRWLRRQFHADVGNPRQIAE
jgi:hypothetical protein